MSIYPFCISHSLYFKLSFLERFWFAFINSVVSFFSFATYAMHWYASKMIEIYELISMHSYRNYIFLRNEQSVMEKNTTKCLQ